MPWSHRRRAGAIALLAAGLASCGPTPAPSSDAGADSGPHGCTYPFLGDPAKPIQVEPLALAPDMTASPLGDGDMVTLAFPPQGGRVIFAGVRATNVDPCGVQLQGVLRDETSKQVRLDSRTVNLKPGTDGWGSSDPTDISTFANIPVCPNEWSKTNLYGNKYQLEIDITDRGGRSLTTQLEVVPACAEPAHEAECLCICHGGYVLGQSCADAGVDDGGAGDAGDAGDGGS